MPLGQRFPDELKQNALSEVKNGATQESVADKYGVGRSTLSLWVAQSQGRTFPSQEAKKGKGKGKAKGKAKAAPSKIGKGNRLSEELKEAVIAEFARGLRPSEVGSRYPQLGKSTLTRLRKEADARGKKEARAAKRADKAGSNAHANGPHVNGAKVARVEAPNGPPITTDERAELLYLRTENARLKAVVNSFTSAL